MHWIFKQANYIRQIINCDLYVVYIETNRLFTYRLRFDAQDIVYLTMHRTNTFDIEYKEMNSSQLIFHYKPYFINYTALK